MRKLLWVACLYVGALTMASAGAPPSPGAHNLAANTGTANGIATKPIETQPSGSTVLALIARGIGSDFTGKPDWATKPVTFGPMDNLDKTPARQLGITHPYSPLWPDSGEALFAWPSIRGGKDHVFTGPMLHPKDEITFAVIEIRNGGKIQDCQWNKTLKGEQQTSLDVTTTGPATLVAIWLGDSGANAVTAVPNNGFVALEAKDSQLNANGWVEAVIATRDVAAAGTYNVTWTSTPAQGCHLWLIAVQSQQP